MKQNRHTHTPTMLGETMFRDQRGFGLVFVLVLTGVLVVMATTMARRARIDAIMQTGDGLTAQNFYLAEAGLNVGMAESRSLFNSLSQPTLSGGRTTPRTYVIDGKQVTYQLTVPTGVTNPQEKTVDAGSPFRGLKTNRFTYVTASYVGAPDGGAVPSAGPVPNALATVRGIFFVDNIPLFQFAAFYRDDLEILPGPTMTLEGRVHTNGDLYLNANATLSIQDNPPRGIDIVQVSTGGSLYRGRKENTNCTGTVEIDALGTVDEDGPEAGAPDDLDDVTVPCVGGSTSQVTDLTPWNGSVSSGVVAIVPPIPSLTGVGTGTHWDNADLRIVLDLDACPAGGICAIRAVNANLTTNVAKNAILQTFLNDPAQRAKLFYNDVPTNPGSPQNATSYVPRFRNDDHVYRRADDGFVDARWNEVNPHAGNLYDYRRGGFRVIRENDTYFYLLNLDLQALLAWDQARITAGLPSLMSAADYTFSSGSTSDGGVVIFLTVRGPQSNPASTPMRVPYAVRVFDSANLPFGCSITEFKAGSCTDDPTGVTIASDLSIYVQGDFNVENAALNLFKDPASFVGDGVNVLSQRWEVPTGGSSFPNDRKTLYNGASDRPALDTEINAGFLAGVDTTSSGNYNGGLENYPRFHEHWNPSGPQQTLRYRGSFVSLGNPLFVTGPWSSQSYGAPVRDWNYDPDFNDPRFLPPLSPNFVFLQQQLFAQSFE